MLSRQTSAWCGRQLYIRLFVCFVKAKARLFGPCSLRRHLNANPVVSWNGVVLSCNELTAPDMTRIVPSMKQSPAVELGCWIRSLRQKERKTLREVAAAAGMDPALLSKIEHGNRLPTSPQAAALARSFSVPEQDVQARRIAVDFVARHGCGESQQKALSIIRATIKRLKVHDAG